eukprot:scaffold90456_cov67-Phaeocystis_antarctica.AAC.6
MPCTKCNTAQSYGRYYAHSCEADWSVAGDAPSSVWLRSELSEPENGDCRSSEDIHGEASRCTDLELTGVSLPRWGWG